MIEATYFSLVNVGVGFCLAWVLTHYVCPYFFGGSRNLKRSFAVTVIFTVAALARNFVVYSVFTS
jgi:hypothetical protein